MTKNPASKPSNSNGAFNSQTPQNGLKINISEKKKLLDEDKIGIIQDSISNKDADKKIAKRRTKEERLTSALDSNYSN